MMRSGDIDGMSRRDFLRASGVGGAAALLAGANVVTWADVASAAENEPLPTGTGILVVVTMYGGNDGLNTVVPYTDAVYQSRRPGLAFTESEVLPIGEGLGLNSAMPGMKAMWDAGHLAIVRGVGYPAMNHSHFTSMDIWQSATPSAPSTSGWLGRWLDGMPRHPLHALNIGNSMPPMLVGRTVAGSCLPVGGLTTATGSLGRNLRRLGAAASDYTDLRADAATAMADLYSNSTATQRALATAIPGAPVSGTSSLAQQLDVVARLINAGTPTRVYSVSIAGFDTHADEKGTQASLLGQLSDALSTFIAQVNLTSRRDDVTVLAFSEFGRRVPGNLSQGTDHGTAGPAFVLGNRVHGGFHGAQPDLSRLNADDLEVTTDFRDIYATLLERVLASEADAVLPRWAGRLPLLAS